MYGNHETPVSGELKFTILKGLASLTDNIFCEYWKKNYEWFPVTKFCSIKTVWAWDDLYII
jgi:hypothetical protein